MLSCYVCVLNSDVGNLLLKRLSLAIAQAAQSRGDFNDFDACLRQEIPKEVIKMEIKLAAWNEDRSSPDPYRTPKSSE